MCRVTAPLGRGATGIFDWLLAGTRLREQAAGRKPAGAWDSLNLLYLLRTEIFVSVGAVCSRDEWRHSGIAATSRSHGLVISAGLDGAQLLSLHEYNLKREVAILRVRLIYTKKYWARGNE
jgi:hypothetical protein